MNSPISAWWKHTIVIGSACRHSWVDFAATPNPCNQYKHHVLINTIRYNKKHFYFTEIPGNLSSEASQIKAVAYNIVINSWMNAVESMISEDKKVGIHVTLKFYYISSRLNAHRATAVKARVLMFVLILRSKNTPELDDQSCLGFLAGVSSHQPQSKQTQKQSVMRMHVTCTNCDLTWFQDFLNH